MVTLYSQERHVAEEAVLKASILTKRAQSKVYEISKSDNSPVTVADFAAQALLILALREAFPNDSFVGEEDAAALRADPDLRDEVFDLVSSMSEKPVSVEEVLDAIDLGGQGVGGDKGRFWVMDPVDGTAAFLKGQQYAVSLALIEDGHEVVGIMGCPNISADMSRISEEIIDLDGLGIMLSAIRGQGATMRTMTPNGIQPALLLNTLTPSDSNKLHIVDYAATDTCYHDVVAILAEKFKAAFPNTDVCSSHIRYAAQILGGGDVQFWVPISPSFQMLIWDHAGSQLIFTELGGKVTDLDGKKIDFGAGRGLTRNRGMVAARGDIHQTILATMANILEDRDRVMKHDAHAPVTEPLMVS